VTSKIRYFCKKPHPVIPVKPKKALGQHFLTDKNISRKIVNSLSWRDYTNLLEIGPGTGILSEFLLVIPEKQLKFIEIDKSAVEFLISRFPEIHNKIMNADIMQVDFQDLFEQPFAIIGNFPYNLSSQIFFKILDSRDRVREVVCMIQKEVANRLASPPGSKEYGILSVLLQAYFKIEYLFTVPPQVFYPPPKVHSAVIRLRRNNNLSLHCDELMFVRIVKTAFNQRRKTLRNSLKDILSGLETKDNIFQKRPEQLSVEEFIQLTKMIDKQIRIR
jgi:16S rRNA (adenine1518-N6/adenine1519-N6)-dimethyltransferase